MKYACPEGHTADIQATAWYDMNTGEMTGGDAPRDDYFCGTCCEEGMDGDFSRTMTMPDVAEEIGAYVDGYAHGARTQEHWISWEDAKLRPSYTLLHALELWRAGVEDGSNGDPFRLKLVLEAMKAEPVIA